MMKELLLCLVLGLAHTACAEQPDVDTQGAAGTAGSTGSSTTAHFSFFLVSYGAIHALSGNPQGFGGDLRYGESGAGAGLRGAERICGEVAEISMPGNRKTWRAFLSTNTEDAIDRIGDGPWYDRLGRVFASKRSELLATRPTAADIS